MKKKEKKKKTAMAPSSSSTCSTEPHVCPCLQPGVRGVEGAVTYEEMVVQGGLPSDTDKNVWGQTVSQ